MKMETVQLVPSQQVEDSQQIFRLVDLPRDVEKHTAPRQAGRVDDFAGRRKDELLRLVPGGAQDLAERHEAIEETLLLEREKGHRVSRKADPVSILGHLHASSYAGDSAGVSEELWDGREQASGQPGCRIEGELGFARAFHEVERACDLAPASDLDLEGKGKDCHREHPARQSRRWRGLEVVDTRSPPSCAEW